MAGIALYIENIVGQTTEIGQLAAGGAEGSRPGVVDPQIGQLRKDLHHVGPHDIGQVVGHLARIADAAAENHPSVRAQAVIVNLFVGVPGGSAVGQDGGGQVRRQGLGSDLIVVGGQDARRDLLGQMPQVAIAAVEQKVRRDLTLAGFDQNLLAVDCLFYKAALVDFGARALGRPGDSQGQIQRMQMAAGGVVKRSAVGRRADHLGGLLPVEQLIGVIAVVAGDQRGMVGEDFQIPLGYRAAQVARPIGAVDGFLRDQCLDQGLGVLGQVPERPGVIRAVTTHQVGLQLDVGRPQLSAVAPRRAIAHLVGLQQDHFVSLARQMQGRGQAGKAAANDADITGRRAVQRWRRKGGSGGGGVQRGRVGHGRAC